MSVMKTCMVIPSYWGRPQSDGWQEGDAVYDHPIPLDQEGTLLRTLKSLEVLESRELTVVVLAVPAAEEIAEAVERKVQEMIDTARQIVEVPILGFGMTHLKEVHHALMEADLEEGKDLLQLRGYSNVRNLCTFVPHLMGSDVAILIDDDEVFEDPKFLDKALEFVGRTYQGIPVHAVAGYYLQENGDYHLDKPREPWMEAWDQLDRMNEAFDRFIAPPPRLKETPFVFGGNMVLHRDLFTKVPFDPLVPRGEDIDFLINAKMFGFRFFLDNTLSIKHLPPPKFHPVWRRLREDVFRFLFEREKIRRQEAREGWVQVRPEDFDPYPGAFLKEDLEDKVTRASHILAELYETSGDAEGKRAALETVSLMREALNGMGNPFRDLMALQNRWEHLMRGVETRRVREACAFLFEPSEKTRSR